MSVIDDALDYFRKELGLPLAVKLGTSPIGTHLDIIDGEYVICLGRNKGTDVRLYEIAHECVHIRQMEDGRLRHEGDKTIWCGKEMDDTKYFLPWEIEAREIGYTLVCGFVEGKNLILVTDD